MWNDSEVVCRPIDCFSFDSGVLHSVLIDFVLTGRWLMLTCQFEYKLMTAISVECFQKVVLTQTSTFCWLQWFKNEMDTVNFYAKWLVTRTTYFWRISCIGGFRNRGWTKISASEINCAECHLKVAFWPSSWMRYIQRTDRRSLHLGQWVWSWFHRVFEWL